MPDLKELADLVRRMRDKQKLYFRSRSSAALNESRDLEKRVDKAVDEVLNPPAPGLPFDRDEEG